MKRRLTLSIVVAALSLYFAYNSNMLYAIMCLVLSNVLFMCALFSFVIDMAQEIREQFAIIRELLFEIRYKK